MKVLANIWSEFSSAPYFVYTNSEGSGRTLQMHCSSDPSLLADVKLKSQIMMLDFLQSKLKYIKLFQ